MTARTLSWAGPARCPRCKQTDPPEGHDQTCAAWHTQMAAAEKAAQAATRLTPSYPVRPVEAIDVLAHLNSRGVPDPSQVLQVVLDLGWRPVKGALTAQDTTAADPAGTEPLEGL